MVRSVVIILVFLEQAAEKHRAGYHKEISSDYDHDDRHKEPYKSLYWVINADRKVICGAEEDNSEHAEQPIRLRCFFTRVFALYEVDRT